MHANLTSHAPRTAAEAAAMRTFAFGGPGFSPAKTASELRLARCCPTEHCPQLQRCARSDSRLCDHRQVIVDGTALRGDVCPLFVDRRGVVPHETPPGATR